MKVGSAPGARPGRGEAGRRGSGIVEKAVELLTKAIELGNGEALFVRGVCSEKGIGVEKSAEDAKNWYAKAAEKGVIESALMA